MASVAGAALVKGPINLSGALFNKTRVDTPIFNMIGQSSISSRSFITGATYDLGYPSAPAGGISETASMTAPAAKHWERVNDYNVTQIFMEAVEISYRKLANGADLNNYSVGTAQQALAGNTNNVPDELSFQLANTMDKIKLDLEYTLLNGTFADSAGAPAVADKTRGLIAAITSNVEAASGAELAYEMIYDTAQSIMQSGSPYGLESYVTVLNFEQFKQLQKVVIDEGLKLSYETAGVNVASVVTPFGIMRFMPHRFMPNGTAICVCAPVLGHKMQPTPGKGNFFYEELAKTGAGTKGQVFGMWGLDHGPEFVHAKITGLATTTSKFTAPKIFVTNGPTDPVGTVVTNGPTDPVGTVVTNGPTDPVSTSVTNGPDDPISTKEVPAVEVPEG